MLCVCVFVCVCMCVCVYVCLCVYVCVFVCCLFIFFFVVVVFLCNVTQNQNYLPCNTGSFRMPFYSKEFQKMKITENVISDNLQIKRYLNSNAKTVKFCPPLRRLTVSIAKVLSL